MKKNLLLISTFLIAIVSTFSCGVAKQSTTAGQESAPAQETTEVKTPEAPKYGKYGPDSAKCIQYLSFYTEYFKQKEYDRATINWREAYKYCPPTSRYSMLTDGTTLIRNLINKNRNNFTYRQELIDSLMTIYDQRVEYWPKYAISSLNNKAKDINNFYSDNPEYILNEFTKIFSQTKEETSPSLFIHHLNNAVDLYKSGMITADTVIEIYETDMEYLSNITPKNETDAKNIQALITDFESIFIGSQVASCDNLITLFTPRQQAAPEDVDLAKKIVKIMGMTEDCLDNELFLNAVTTVYNNDPSHTSAYYLYKLHMSKGNTEEAIKYIEEAIAAEDSDAVTDGNYNYELAVYYLKNGQKVASYNKAQLAATQAPELAGKCYMIMGQIWASTGCGGNEIQRRAPYWVAVDFMVKAKNADPSLTEEANKNIGTYSYYYPQTAEAFMYDIQNGQSYTVACGGLRATTTVRTRN